MYDVAMCSRLKPVVIFHFEFTEGDRKQLAKLKVGQEVSIKGKLKQFVPPECSKGGRGKIVFEACKIVSPTTD